MAGRRLAGGGVKLVLVGAGGNGRATADTLRAAGHEICAYADPARQDWLAAPHLADDAAIAGMPAEFGIALGLGGVRPADLRRRLALFDRLLAQGRAAPALCDPRAFLSPQAQIAGGAVVKPQAAVEAFARIGRAAIVNTGALIAHDAVVGAGAHVALGAVVLGGARVGECALVGANAVVLPGAQVPADAVVPAATRFQAPKP